MDKKGVIILIAMTFSVLISSLCALACCIIAICIFAGAISADFSVAVVLLLTMVILGLLAFVLVSHINSQLKR